MSNETAPSAPLGRYYEVDGRRLLLHRVGSGNPPVICLAGAGGVGLDYFAVQSRTAGFAASVIYDRAGTGWSDDADLPRSSAVVTDELRALLKAADLAPPFLFVGHSLGGLYARHYAVRFPAEVAGLVLLDPAHEDYSAYMPKELSELRSTWKPDQAISDAIPEAVITFYRGLFAREMADWPELVRDPLADYHVSPQALKNGFREASNVEALYDEIRRAGPLPDVPLIILSAMGIDDFKKAVLIGETEDMLQAECDAKHRLYTDFARTVPRGEVRAVDAGHVTIPFRCADKVAEAVRDAMRQAGERRAPPA